MRICGQKSHCARLIIGCGLAFVLGWPPAIAEIQQPEATIAYETYTYDSAGRLTQVTYGDGSSIRYFYDKNGNILSVQTADNDIIFSDGFEQ